MSIVIVDNNASTLYGLENEINTRFPDQEILSFTDPFMSAKYICNNKVDLAFLAVGMRPVDGFVLLHTLRANKPSLPIVMLLDNEEQKGVAICEKTSGYLVKPVAPNLLINAVKRELLYLS